MCIKLKNDIPVCQRARRLTCSEKLQVNNQIDDWLRQGIIKESVFDYCSDIVLCKKANGAMKTSSVEFISRSPNPLPMKSKHHRFVLLEGSSSPGSGNEGKRENRFKQTSRTLQRKISMRSTKDQLVKKRRSHACETQCFPVEPSGCRRDAFMMEKLSSSTKF
ncbi:hypothetical protein TNCV_2666001 [Trichonephila clavipes]|nr:hypothetical protein TNCV_2666001 [Trichonephila clavipes]